MNIISSISQVSYQPKISINKLDSSKRDIDLEAIESKRTLPKVDMRNISYAELQDLIKTAVDEGLVPKNFVFPQPLPPDPFMTREEYANHKFDYLGQQESVFAFNKSQGEGTSNLNEVINILTQFHSPRSGSNAVGLSGSSNRPPLATIATQEWKQWTDEESVKQQRLEFLLKTDRKSVV